MESIPAPTKSQNSGTTKQRMSMSTFGLGGSNKKQGSKFSF
jgi:hypothetical protein